MLKDFLNFLLCTDSILPFQVEKLKQWLTNVHLKLGDLPTDCRGCFTQEMLFPVIEYGDIIYSCSATSLHKSDKCFWLIRFSVYHNTTIFRPKMIVPLLFTAFQEAKDFWELELRGFSHHCQSHGLPFTLQHLSWFAQHHMSRCWISCSVVLGHAQHVQVYVHEPVPTHAW